MTGAPGDAPPVTTSATQHGSHELVSWCVVRSRGTSSSIQLHGTDEAAARADYDHRRKTLHRGESIRLERSITATSWVSHTDVVGETGTTTPT